MIKKWKMFEKRRNIEKCEGRKERERKVGNK